MFIQLGACWESWINAFVIVIKLDNFQLVFFFPNMFSIFLLLGLNFILISSSCHWITSLIILFFHLFSMFPTFGYFLLLWLKSSDLPLLQCLICFKSQLCNFQLRHIFISRNPILFFKYLYFLFYISLCVYFNSWAYFNVKITLKTCF